jgi:hypothetical protein
MIVWVAFLLFIAYGFLKSCLRRNSVPQGPAPQPPGSRPRPSGWGPSGWFPGDHFNNDVPPPYSKSTSEAPQRQGWRPGFWTGAAAGAAGASLFNRAPTTNTPPTSVPWDWERAQTSSSWFGRGRTTTPSSNDRGEGSSNLGSMRRSTGLGGSNVR